MRCATGRPVPFVDFPVVNENMKDVARDGRQQCEIVLRAPFLTKTYVGAPEAFEELDHAR